MPPRPLTRAARLALAVPLALALGLACDEGTADRCPGARVARLELDGTRNLEPDPATPGVPACGADVGYGDAPVTVTGVLAQASTSARAAFCAAPPAAVLFGDREGDTFDLAGDTGGAVLGGCGGTCSATLTVILRGALTPGVGGAAGTFAGTYIERLERAAGDCGGCTLPCDGRYDVTGTATP